MAREPRPERLLVPTCVGCGAMAILGSCQHGCSEQRLELVGADSLDELAPEAARSRAAVDALLPVLEELAGTQPPAEELESAYRRLQALARAALRAHPAAPEADEDPPTATTWWCPECGGLEAPQPCLAICVWRPVEWVRREEWLQESRRVHAERRVEAAVRGVVRRLGFATPRAGQWEASWRTLSLAAQQTLESVTRSAPGQAR